MHRRTLLQLPLLAPVLTQRALAQGDDSSPLQVVVPYGPGGTGDVIARALAPHLSESLRRNVVIVNRPGATGMIGADSVARAAPDGRTLLLGYTSEVAINPDLYPSARYKISDFAPVSLAGVTPLVLVARADLPSATLREFVAAAKAQPGRFNYASAGAGSPAHIAGELLLRRAGLRMTHVPYRGGAPAVMDVLAKNVDIYFSGMPPAVPHVLSGAIRAYAVTGTARSPALPAVPTMDEAGFADFDLSGWFGFLAPAGTPSPTILRQATAVRDALARPDVAEVLRQQGIEPRPTSPEAFGTFLTGEAAKYRDLVQQLSITANQ
ncbi:MAG TPA: tripartite tricarboxylate transporter substrate binding protein [Roseomonas sp.]|jgi:tripartite-type tricarboxylate transporter receptor subunit TctC